MLQVAAMPVRRKSSASNNRYLQERQAQNLSFIDEMFLLSAKKAIVAIQGGMPVADAVAILRTRAIQGLPSDEAMSFVEMLTRIEDSIGKLFGKKYQKIIH